MRACLLGERRARKNHSGGRLGVSGGASHFWVPRCCGRLRTRFVRVLRTSGGGGLPGKQALPLVRLLAYTAWPCTGHRRVVTVPALVLRTRPRHTQPMHHGRRITLRRSLFPYLPAACVLHAARGGEGAGQGVGTGARAQGQGMCQMMCAGRRPSGPLGCHGRCV